MGEIFRNERLDDRRADEGKQDQPINFLRALEDRRAQQGSGQSAAIENLKKAWPGVNDVPDEGYGPAFLRHWGEKPVQGTAEAAATAGLAAAAIRYMPRVVGNVATSVSESAAGRVLPAIAERTGLTELGGRVAALEASTTPGLIARAERLAPRLVSYGAGAFGLAKLITTDAHDLWTSRSGSDVLKYGLASMSDLAMVAGTVARFTPLKRYNLAFTALGLAGRGISSLLPDSGKPRQQAADQSTMPKSERDRVSLNLSSNEAQLRPFDIYVPPTADKNRPLPVVFALHGVANGNAAGLMEGEMQLNKLARERGFIAVYPIARAHGPDGYEDWNSPGSGLSARDSSYDDTDYIKAILTKLRQNQKIDDQRIYAVGFSSGGAFAQHLRGTMPGTFAGIGSIHGTLLGTEAKAPEDPSRRSAFVSVLSDNDDMLPVTGGRGLATYLMGFPRIAASQPLNQVEVARQANGYGPQANVTNVGPVEIKDYTPQTPGSAPVLQLLVRGGAAGGKLGWLVGRGRDGFPAQHAVDGTGSGGFPLIGDKNRDFDPTRFVIDTIMSYRLPRSVK